MALKITKRDVSYGLSLILLVTAAFVAASGLLADALDLNEFVPHKYGGYLLVVLAGGHVYLHWPRLVGYWRRRLMGRVGRGHPTVPRLRQSQEPEAGEGGQSRMKGRWGLGRRGFLLAAVTAVGGFLVGRRTAPASPVALTYGADVGHIYHEWSKPGYLKLLGSVANWGRRPPQYKGYAWAERIELPSPVAFRGLSVEEAIERRRSVRDYTGQPMPLEQLSQLLHGAAGITAERWGIKLRAAPSAGALYPIELYPVVHSVSGLVSGVYHYVVAEHALELLKKGDFRSEIMQYALGQEFLGEANVVFVFSAIFQRTRWKYRERTYRYVLLEAGHIAENIYLAATSMGLGACAVGAFFDDDLNRLLDLDGQHEAVIYLMAVGET